MSKLAVEAVKEAKKAFDAGHVDISNNQLLVAIVLYLADINQRIEKLEQIASDMWDGQ